MKNGCIANKRGACSAANPKINSINVSFFPEDIQVRIEQRGLNKGEFKRCVYCGTVWVKLFENGNEVELGTRKLGSDKMEWTI